MARTIIGVIGSGSPLAPKTALISERIGRDIAKSGCVLLCGGLGGVMEAAARGAKEEGGSVVGILPGLDAGEANDYIDIPLSTGFSHARNALIASSSSALISIKGNTGTLSEICLALRYGKAVIAVKGSGGVSESAESYIKSTGSGNERIYTEDPENAVRRALELAGSME